MSDEAQPSEPSQPEAPAAPVEPAAPAESAEIERPRWLSEGEDIILSFRRSARILLRGLDYVIVMLIPVIWFLFTKKTAGDKVIYLPIPWSVVIIGISWFAIYAAMKAYYGEKKVPTNLLLAYMIIPLAVVIILQILLELPAIEITGDVANILFNMFLYGLAWALIYFVARVIIEAMPMLGVKYYITTNRVVIRRMIFGHKEIPLIQIESTTVTKPTLWHKLFNVGHIYISTSGEKTNLILPNIYKPDEVIRKINDARLRLGG